MLSGPELAYGWRCPACSGNVQGLIWRCPGVLLAAPRGASGGAQGAHLAVPSGASGGAQGLVWRCPGGSA
eukprot:11595237-Alexandrium_andersonii.AAC.1